MPEYFPREGKVVINEDGSKSHSLIPTIYIGEGTTDEGEKFEILTTWNQSPVVRFEDGSQIVWRWKELIQEAFEIRNKEIKKTDSPAS